MPIFTCPVILRVIGSFSIIGDVPSKYSNCATNFPKSFALLKHYTSSSAEYVIIVRSKEKTKKEIIN